MTNKEAIKILSEYPSMVVMPLEQRDYKEACNMAIKALKDVEIMQRDSPKRLRRSQR